MAGNFWADMGIILGGLFFSIKAVEYFTKKDKNK